MRFARLLGLLLVLAGTYVLWQRPTYPAQVNVVEIGDVRASVEGRQPVPLWTAGTAVGLGLILLLMAASERR